MQFITSSTCNSEWCKNTFPLMLSEACQTLIKQARMHWTVDFIWHYQNLELFKDNPCQQWVFERQFTRHFIPAVSITCYAARERVISQQVLLQANVDYLEFEFDRFILWYDDGRCMLPGERSHSLVNYAR